MRAAAGLTRVRGWVRSGLAGGLSSGLRGSPCPLFRRDPHHGRGGGERRGAGGAVRGGGGGGGALPPGDSGGSARVSGCVSRAFPPRPCFAASKNGWGQRPRRRELRRSRHAEAGAPVRARRGAPLPSLRSRGANRTGHACDVGCTGGTLRSAPGGGGVCVCVWGGGGRRGADCTRMRRSLPNEPTDGPRARAGGLVLTRAPASRVLAEPEQVAPRALSRRAPLGAYGRPRGRDVARNGLSLIYVWRRGLRWRAVALRCLGALHVGHV